MSNSYMGSSNNDIFKNLRWVKENNTPDWQRLADLKNLQEQERIERERLAAELIKIQDKLDHQRANPLNDEFEIGGAL